MIANSIMSCADWQIISFSIRFDHQRPDRGPSRQPPQKTPANQQTPSQTPKPLKYDLYE